MKGALSADARGASSYLAYSLTDLMTSLMVIFVLLLLVFLNHTAGLTAAKTDALLALLQRELPKDGFRADQIALDPKDRFAVVVTVPNELMNFELNSYSLRPEGEQFLDTRFPRFAGILCGGEFRGSIDSVVVEGHSDATPYRGLTLEESRNRNLKLSQDRSMEVVKRALQVLGPYESDRACFLEKLSAAGRGEQDLEATADRSRRVIFKIRVKAESRDALSARIANLNGR
jgi:flagellar motor protein MotB